MSEMECHRDSVWTGMEFDSLRAPGAAKAISSQLQGHVAYISDAEEMRRALSIRSSGRHAKQKWGWNELFEATAVQWHAEDPAACDEWLKTWPENAQTAARYFIGEAESKAKANAEANAETHPAQKEAPESEPGTKPEQSVLLESSSPASPPDGPTPPPAQSPPLPDA